MTTVNLFQVRVCKVESVGEVGEVVVPRSMTAREKKKTPTAYEPALQGGPRAKRQAATLPARQNLPDIITSFNSLPVEYLCAVSARRLTLALYGRPGIEPVCVSTTGIFPMFSFAFDESNRIHIDGGNNDTPDLMFDV